MAWGRWISSAATQVVLTLSIFVLALFILGFVADPIINLYVDPYSALASPSSLKTKIEPVLTDDDAVTWTEHFIKGLASLGLLGFVKVLFALSPWQWWNIRSSGIINAGGRSGNTGRDRLAGISWIVVAIGIGTFIWVCPCILKFLAVQIDMFHATIGSLQRRSCLESSNSGGSRREGDGCRW